MKMILVFCLVVFGISRYPGSSSGGTVQDKDGGAGGFTDGGANGDVVTLAKLQQEHPLCFSKDLFETTKKMGNVSSTKVLNLAKVGKWIKIGRNLTHPSLRYNHTCPNMKYWYNCAKKDTISSFQYGDLATDWKLILILRIQQQ